MSLETTYTLAGEDIKPVNAADIRFKLDFTGGITGDIEEAELTTDSIILSNRAKRICLNHIDQFGIFQGIPLTIQVGGLSLEYYVDIDDNPKISGEGDSEIEVNIKRRKAIDWFRQEANGLSFEAINITNPINTLLAPYLIVFDNQLEMLIMLGISTFTLVKALIEGIQDIVIAVTEVIQAATPNAGVPPSFNTGAIISAVILLAARIIYVAALVVALIQLTKQIIELIFPPVRFLKATKVRELIDKGCQKLGFTFQSSIMDTYENLTILPVPLKDNNQSVIDKLFTLNNGSYTKGYPTAKDTTPTLGTLFDFMEDFAQAQLRIIGTVVYLEEDEFWVQQSGLQIINTLNLQDVRENQWTYNIFDFWKRYIVSWRYDISDFHTMDKIDKIDVELSTEAVNLTDPDLFNVKGLIDIDLSFAYGTRKNNLTFVEKQALPFAELADSVVQFFGGNSSLVSQINARVGVTQIGQQYYSVSKMLFATNGRQPANYLDKIGAKVIYDLYHTKKQVKENFKRIYQARIPFSDSNFEMILGNNFVTDEQGNSLQIRTLEWINESREASIEYAIKSNEGDNTQTILING